MPRRLTKERFKGIKRMINPKKTATRKLAPGPAKDTFSIPFFGSLKLKGLTGTGFAQPNTGPLPAVIIKRERGIIKDPKKSKCFNGFKVKRPLSLAVESPKDKAALP